MISPAALARRRQRGFVIESGVNVAHKSDCLGRFRTVFGLGLLGTGAAYLIYYYIIGGFTGEPISLLDMLVLVLILGGVVLIQTGRRS